LTQNLGENIIYTVIKVPKDLVSDFAIFQMMLTLPNDWDIHDRIIAATARFYQVVLMTRDDVLRGYADLETVWD
jgi:PIN domain nuclease of toxin-antitoxin system